MNLYNIGNTFDYELEKTARLFMPFEKIKVLHETENELPDSYAECISEKLSHGVKLTARLKMNGKTAEHTVTLHNGNPDFERACEYKLAAQLYDCFAEISGFDCEWGILTGVRPARLFSKCVEKYGSTQAKKLFCEEFKVNEKKLSLCEQTVLSENKIISLSAPESFSLYLSVPFCPSRCSYCSFVSHSVEQAAAMIPTYVDYLCEELKFTAEIASRLGLKLETVYVGGGTPTTLTAEQLNRVLKTVRENFDVSGAREFTVEAGRPDTSDFERLSAIYENGAGRISINPQTFNDGVLEAIGRRHTSAQTEKAFALARKIGFGNINMDLIAGLPTDTVKSFENTLERAIELAPESITVHSLSVKRSSRLTASGTFPDYSDGEAARIMVDTARSRLTEVGIYPYYMYRQSKTVGNLENVGYARKGFEGLYNVYIMDETHTILACGASAVTKLKQPNGEHIERIFNFKYPYEYIGRFEEQLHRKEGIKTFYEKYT